MHEKLLTRHEVAERLALSLASVDRLLASGRLPFLRIGGAIRFRPAAIDQWLDRDCTAGAKAGTEARP